jgi:hypothetical protein
MRYETTTTLAPDEALAAAERFSSVDLGWRCGCEAHRHLGSKGAVAMWRSASSAAARRRWESKRVNGIYR